MWVTTRIELAENKINFWHKKFKIVAVPGNDTKVKCLLKSSFQTQSTPSPTSQYNQKRKEKSTHALIKKRFLFIRQHATQQQAQTILRIIAESKAPEGSECDTERTSRTKKVRKMSTPTTVKNPPLAISTLVSGLRRKAWKALNYTKIYFNLHPLVALFSHSLSHFHSKPIIIHITFPTGLYIKKKKPPKPKYVES